MVDVSRDLLIGDRVHGLSCHLCHLRLVASHLVGQLIGEGEHEAYELGCHPQIGQIQSAARPFFIARKWVYDLLHHLLSHPLWEWLQGRRDVVAVEVDLVVEHPHSLHLLRWL